MSELGEFMFEGASLKGRCGYCKRFVDNHDESHRVTSVMRGGKGVECVARGDIDYYAPTARAALVAAARQQEVIK